MTDLRKILDEATPGPWKTHLVDDTTIIATDGTDVATTCDSANVERSDAYNVEYERMEANARLIALAPDLAAALIKAEEALRPFAEIGISENPEYQPMIRMDRDAIIAARAALSEIKKLRGE